MTISAAQVKELRDISGVGMMECKKALTETDGDVEKALDLLRSNSALKAEKKSSRTAADGLIVIAQTSEYSALAEINSETDFAAKDSKFLEFCNEVKSHLEENRVESVEALNNNFNEKRESLVQAIGENIQIRRLDLVENVGSVGTYLHSDSKLGALVSINVDNFDLAKDLAMHAAASNPSCITQDDIDKDILEREKAIYKKQAEESGKDEKIMEKMVEGKVRRFLEEVSFVSQPFVKNPDQKIQELLDERGAAIVMMSRFKVGDGIEVEKKDFASEVAEQLK